jgi:hypothetical protein
MKKRLARLRNLPSSRQAGAFTAGTLIGAAFWTPVFAASSDQAQDWKLIGIVIAAVLLVLAVALKSWAGSSPAPRYRMPRSFDSHGGTRHGEIVNTGGDD